MKGLVLDAGALIALDRGNRDMHSEIRATRLSGAPVRTSPIALGDLLYTSDPGDPRKLCGAAGIRALVIGC